MLANTRCFFSGSFFKKIIISLGAGEVRKGRDF